MRTFLRLMSAEFVKLRHSSALRMLWAFPLLFFAIEFLIFERPLLSLKVIPPELTGTLDMIQIRTAGALWGGFFHPLILALLPALIFRPEHRFKLWRHLHAMPVPRRAIYLCKGLTMLLLCAGILGLIWLGFCLERRLIAWFNPLVAFPSHGLALAKVLAWMFLGSLPLLALYLWVSDRIQSMAVPVVFGLIGLMLIISLSGQDVGKPWKRDLNPWVLPYIFAQRAVEVATARQEVHLAGKPFAIEPDTIRLWSGRKVKTRQNVPDDVLFPPPPPTPIWIFKVFSLGAGLILFGLGWVDARRNRY